MTKLNDMIRQAITGAESDEGELTKEASAASEAPVGAPSLAVDEAVKVASALRFISNRGVESFLTKEAASACAAPEGTNQYAPQRFHTQSQVGPHAASPPMDQGGNSGPVETNLHSRPGGGASQAAGSAGDSGKDHKALSSNEAAISFSKKEKAKQVSPTLNGLLNASPFTDGKLKENLTAAAEKGDKNINKTAGQSQWTPEQVRRELELRAAEA